MGCFAAARPGSPSPAPRSGTGPLSEWCATADPPCRPAVLQPRLVPPVPGAARDPGSHLGAAGEGLG